MGTKTKTSKINNDPYCFLCWMTYGEINMRNPERHHCLHGSGRRDLAEADGLWVILCHEHHRRLHDFGEHDRELQQIAQRVYIAEHGREEYFKRYGKFYD